MRDLATLGGTVGGPSALNNRGQVIGSSNLSGDQSAHPFLWEQGNLIDLYANTKGGNPLTADDINDAGEIVGTAVFPNRASDAYLWKKGVATDLGTLDGDCYSEAFAINSRAQVVGQSYPCTSNTQRAFLWENGSITDLNTLIPPRSSLLLVWPMAINDREEIGGVGLPAGCDASDPDAACGHAFLLIPCDENHPGVEGCDYSLVDAPSAVPQTSAAVGNAASRKLPQSLVHGMNRYRINGLQSTSR